MRRTIPLAFVLLLPQAMTAQDRPTGRFYATRSEAVGQNGMAATSHPTATQVALDILKAGGTAVDAAIAANAILCVGEPTGSGIGGDLFAIVWDQKQQRLFGLNGSGRSPKDLTLAQLRRVLKEKGETRIPKRGALPVSVPGCVDGWFTLHKRFGKLPMQKVLAPAAGYARDGIVIPQVIAHYWKLNVDVLEDYPHFKEVFLPWGRPPKAGVERNSALSSRNCSSKVQRACSSRCNTNRSFSVTAIFYPRLGTVNTPVRLNELIGP